MYRETASLILYSDLPADSILMRLSAIFEDWSRGSADPMQLTHRCYREMKRLLDLSTEYGFDGNLWQNYLTWLLITHPNSFSLTCERRGASDGSINSIARHDYAVFLRLYHFDFAPIEKALDIDCFTTLTHYRAIPKRAQLYNRYVSERVRSLTGELAGADAQRAFELLTAHFRDYGMGLFGLNRAFRVQGDAEKLAFQPINNVEDVTLDSLVGYELQKAALRANMEAFVSGRPFNNTLLYGDAGTGKSTSVKAVLTEFQDRGLRMIEIYKHQFHLLSAVIAAVKNRAYRFVLFIDDLSFDEGEVEYKFLKAVIEGGLETRPDNVMICATSNRRHLVREVWRDRDDMEHNGEVHRSDTMEEKLSLAARFGCSISYSAPDRRLFQAIVRTLAEQHPEISMTEEELLAAANRWEIRHGGLSGRSARQFIDHLAGTAAVPAAEQPG